jgi:aryl-alcohol dehydrogenase-like predicted oxidoreductase
MQMRQLGRTGLRVAALCLGGNVFRWTIDEPQSFVVLDAYAESGGNFIDSADVYARWAPGNHGGESEEVLGNWMAARGNRDQMIIATKLGSPMGDGPNERGLSRQHIIQATEASLRRLRTDYIDLQQSHQDDQATPLEETLRAYDDLIRQGKVRYIGASNFAAWRLMQALWTSDRHGFAPYVSLQPRYNLLARAEFEREVQPMCVAMGIGVIPYSSLASGFLTGKYRPDGDLPISARAGGVQRSYMNARGFRVLAALDAIAGRHDASPAQVSLAWLLAQRAITAPIASATTPDQLRDLLRATELRLTEEDLATLNEASKDAAE